MGVFSSIGDRCFWRLILGHKVVCGQFFRTKHLIVQHCVGESYFLQLTGGGVVTSSTNKEDLNSCCDSCVGITKMEICVARVVHFHLCLLGCAYCLLACWSSCTILSRG
jgi:hypothetical protein